MAGLYGNNPFRRKRRRLVLALAGLVALGLVAVLVLRAMDETMLYFRVPSDVAAEKPPEGEPFRLGGLVAEGSLEHNSQTATARFAVTDGEESLRVVYTGILPDLFREGQGVIAEGAIGEDGVFRAESVLAKHDENYMPPQLAERLEEAGHPGAETVKQ